VKSGARAIIWLLAGLGAILLAAGLIWFLQNFELRGREVDVGYSAAARRNPFLAAERFLRRLDIRVTSLSGRDLLRDLPPPEDTLVLNAPGALNAERREALHGWIEGGGRLIVEALTLWEEPHRADARRDDFLDGYGVRLLELEDPTDWYSPSDEVTAELHRDDYPHPLEVGFAARFYLEDASGEAAGGVTAGGRFRLLQYQIGDGVLTVSGDNRFLTNRHIGRHDNALFLALLAAPRDGGKVWLLYDSAVPGLGALIWHRAPFALISFLSLLGLFLWYLGGRLGPLLPSPVGERRDLLDHLQASAGFLWRQGQGGALADATRTRIERAWFRRHPALTELDRTERAAWIARRTGLLPGEVRRALYPAAANADDLVTETALLQRLWTGLSAPNGPVDAARPPAVVHNSGHTG
jgi:hypothetical protein